MKPLAISPFLRHLFAASTLIAAALLLTACSNQSAEAPTPLAVTNLNGAPWTFTPQNPPNQGVVSLTGSLTSQQGNGDSQSLQAGGTLTINGSCASDAAGPVSLTGALTNPQGGQVNVQLSGQADGGGTLQINGQMVAGNNNAISGTYSISGTGPCATMNAGFSAIRNGTNGKPTAPPPSN